MSIEPEPAAIYAAAMERLAAADLPNARRLMHSAATLGHLPALGFYAAFVEHGVAGKPRPRKAMTWFEKAAVFGDGGASMRLAEWHLANGGTGQAKTWLHKAWPNPAAMLLLASLYARSRPCRATDRGKRVLFSMPNRRSLSVSEKLEYDRLLNVFFDRNPSPSALDQRESRRWRARLRAKRRWWVRLAGYLLERLGLGRSTFRFQDDVFFPVSAEPVEALL